MTTKICENPRCGKEFEPKIWYQIYCEPSCGDKARYTKQKRPVLPPQECGREGCSNETPYRKRNFNKRRDYCSDDCAVEQFRINRRRKEKAEREAASDEEPFRPATPNYRGQDITTTEIMVLRKDLGFAL